MCKWSSSPKQGGSSRQGPSRIKQTPMFAISLRGTPSPHPLCFQQLRLWKTCKILLSKILTGKILLGRDLASLASRYRTLTVRLAIYQLTKITVKTWEAPHMRRILGAEANLGDGEHRRM